MDTTWSSIDPQYAIRNTRSAIRYPQYAIRTHTSLQSGTSRVVPMAIAYDAHPVQFSACQVDLRAAE
jgi:hypothetical protein